MLSLQSCHSMNGDGHVTCSYFVYENSLECSSSRGSGGPGGGGLRVIRIVR